MVEEGVIDSNYSHIMVEHDVEVELLRRNRRTTYRSDSVADLIFHCFSLVPNGLLLAFYGFGIYLVIEDNVRMYICIYIYSYFFFDSYMLTLL